ncbi:RNA polymerase-associated protein [Yarrowia sp. B02]|nr:RNA polymerase-associated protein [Yarrowia sp. B02]
MSENIIEIPCADADGDFISLDLDKDIQEDPEEICVLLENERCDKAFWLAIGLAYSSKGLTNEAIEVVTRALKSPSMKESGDRLPLYNCLVWLFLKQYRSAPVDQRSAVLEKATEYANKAFSIDKTWRVNVLTEAVFKIQTGGWDGALTNFNAVLQTQNTNLLALLGKARVLYEKKNYREALKLYQSVLSQRPSMKPDPRIGVGLCFWSLGSKDEALAAFERANELAHDKNAFVKVMLATCLFDKALQHVQTSDFEKYYALGMLHVKDSYGLDKTHAPTLVQLQKFFFTKRNTDAIVKLGDTAINQSENPKVLAQIHFWTGRAHHLAGHVQQALESFRQAEKFDRDNVGYKLGRALVLWRSNIQEATLLLDGILNSHPKCLEAKAMLGLIYAEQESPKALPLLQQWVAAKGDDVDEEVFLLLSKLENNPKAAVEHLQKVSSEDDPATLNNIAIYQYSAHDYDEAQTSFEKAKGVADEDQSVTITYNIARTLEAKGKTAEARAIYEAMQYPDADIRLAFLDIVESNDGARLESLMDKSGSDLEVRALQGWHLRRTRKTEETHLIQTLTDFDKHDVYALVSFGNWYLAKARSLKPKNNADVDKKNKQYFKAAEFFSKALALDPKCAYAAQGVAVIFAETNRADLAINIFKRVRETITDDISVFVNLGHCFFDLRQYDKAIQSYEIALERFKGGSDVTLLSLLGRAWYARGISAKQLKYLDTALELCRQAVALQADPSTLFNVAFIQFQVAEVLRKTEPSKRTIEELEAAVKGMSEAIASLKELAASDTPPFPKEELEQRASMGNTVVKQLERALVEQQEYDTANSAKLEEARQYVQQREEKAAAEKAEKEKAAAEKAAQLEEERKQQQQQALEWAERMREFNEADEKVEKTSKKSKKALDEFVEDDDTVPVDESESDGESVPAKRKSKKDGGAPKKRRLLKKAQMEEEQPAEEQEDDDMDDLFGDEE